MIEALIAGETNPAKLASLADRRVKASPEKLREALHGRVTTHHRFMLRLHLNQIDALEEGRFNGGSGCARAAANCRGMSQR
jgi:transposase